jgi:hypothetical protein
MQGGGQQGGPVGGLGCASVTETNTGRQSNNKVNAETKNILFMICLITSDANIKSLMVQVY